MLNALASAQMGSIPPTPSIHRLRLGLPGFLIPFATLAFESECQEQTRGPLSPQVFLPISTHFTTTPAIPPPSPALQIWRIGTPSPVKRGPFSTDAHIRLRALYAQSVRTTLASSVLPRLLAQS